MKNGIGFSSLLAVVFITLKVVDKINWSWWYVLAPLYVPILIWIFIGIVVAIFKSPKI